MGWDTGVVAKSFAGRENGEMHAGQLWTRKQLLIAFRLYCRTAFGRLHGRNPEIIKLAAQIGRTPSALAMKACNFASLDPRQQQRRIQALGNVSRADREMWSEFVANPEAMAEAAEAAFAELGGDAPVGEDQISIESQLPAGPTEIQTIVRVRRVQSFFRATVLTSYEGRCAITGLADRALLNASHIIPWSQSVERRADPRNGICLNALLDRAFDRGLITFDEDLRTVVSSRLRDVAAQAPMAWPLREIEGKPLQMPIRFEPDPEAIRYHRETIFCG